MNKNQGVVAERGWDRRIYIVLAVLFLVTSLIGGIDVFAPVSEPDDFERAPVDVVLAEEIKLKSDGAVRVTSRKTPVEHAAVAVEFPSADPLPVFAQVVTNLRNSGIQRARHPTGPPPTSA